MNYDQVNSTLQRVAEDEALYFPEKGDAIARALDRCSPEEILNHLDYAGVIPERFAHDSTEEKLYAKYCDILLARSLRDLGFDAKAIDARGDAADIEAIGGGYELVGDGKAFRLSRTAKNQKDFKVEALSQWKGMADYAVLVSPIYQYPNTRSQIYSQAIRYDVCLISYTHIAFMIRSGTVGPEELRALWGISGKLNSGKDAQSYWQSVLGMILELAGKTLHDWEESVKARTDCIVRQAREQIEFWVQEKARIKTLDHDTVTDMLIDALKIDSKIEMIEKTAGL